MRAISNLPELIELDLRKNYIGDIGCEKISSMMGLKRLKLDFNNISDIGVSYLSKLVYLR